MSPILPSGHTTVVTASLLVRWSDTSIRGVKTVVLTGKGRQTRSTLVHAMTTRSPIAQLSDTEQQALCWLLTKTMVPEEA